MANPDMQSDLENMKTLAKVEVVEIRINVTGKIFTVFYVIRSSDDVVMYSEQVAADLTGQTGLANWKLADMVAWAKSVARADAKTKHGN